MAVNTAITFLSRMKIQHLFEDDEQAVARVAILDCHLYRGVSTDQFFEPDAYHQFPIRTDRRPRDATPFGQIWFNAMFEKAHAVADIRSRSIFCASDIGIAYPYVEDGGTLINVYPLKTAKLAFQQSIDDSGDLVARLTGNIMAIVYDSSLSKLEIKEILADPVFHTTNVTGCGAQITEFINRLTTTHPALTDDITRCVEDAVKAASAYQIISAGNANAIQGSVEVMMFDAPYFYGVVNNDHGDMYD